jgi:hypothetical protein
MGQILSEIRRNSLLEMTKTDATKKILSSVFEALNSSQREIVRIDIQRVSPVSFAKKDGSN